VWEIEPIKLSSDTVYYHITHWKAGSQWLLRIFRAAFPEAVVDPAPKVGHVRERKPEAGRIFPCCYLTSEEYRALKAGKARRMVVIRDLRDTLVAAYFHLRCSNKAEDDSIAHVRSVLTGTNVEDGLIYLMEEWLPQSAEIQRTWLAEREPVIRLEDFMSAPAETLYYAFRRAWGLRLQTREARRLIRNNSFEQLTGGRPPGQEDLTSHYRKGIKGDWRNHFTPRVVEHFKRLYNDTLLLSGYEKSADWRLDTEPKAAFEAIDKAPFFHL